MHRAVVAFLLAACAPSSAPPPSSPEGAADGSSPSLGPSEPGAAAEPPASTEPAPAPTEPPPGVPTLPAVNVRNVGLHVGGGSNDSASKQPFLKAIEAHFPEFLRCYRLIEEPGQEGTFGVDLHVSTAGGAAKVEQPRTGLAGEAFRACMVSAFEKVSFEKVKKPVVISYSLRFSVEQ